MLSTLIPLSGVATACDHNPPGIGKSLSLDFTTGYLLDFNPIKLLSYSGINTTIRQTSDNEIKFATV